MQYFFKAKINAKKIHIGIKIQIVSNDRMLLSIPTLPYYATGNPTHLHIPLAPTMLGPFMRVDNDMGTDWTT